MPIVQSYITVCCCVRSRVSTGTTMYGVMSLYASMYAVLVLCLCSSHISVCVREFLFLSVVFMLIYSCVCVLIQFHFACKYVLVLLLVLQQKEVFFRYIRKGHC